MTYGSVNHTAERLAIVLADANTNDAILDVLKDIIIDMENLSQISSYHPEVIKIVFPLMVEELGRFGEGFHYTIRCIIENENAIDQTIFDAAPKDSNKSRQPLDLAEVETPAENSCIDLARHISAVIKDERTPEKMREAMEHWLGENNSDKLTDFVESPEYIASQLCD